jgi:hypothetical protein
MVCDGSFQLDVAVIGPVCTSSCSYVVQVDDDVPPEITCPPDVSVECIDDVPDPDANAVSASDNCGPFSVSWEGDTPVGDCPTIISRVYKATDECDNMSTCTQTITVNDTTPPVITCPADATYECDSVPSSFGDATATDNCDVDVDIDLVETTTPGACAQEYTITRVFTATDDCGNTDDCTQVISVVDTTPPVITCPVDVTIDCTESVPAADFAGGSASDNCSVPTVTHEGDVSAGDCPEIITRTYRATDECGNWAECTQTITIVDETPPVITCPADVTLECDQPIPPPDTSSVSTSDDCHDVTVTHEGDVSDGQTCPETITRTYRATDECGNWAECVQYIVIDDTTAPTVSCNSTNVEVACGEPYEFTATGSDNCDANPVVACTFVSTNPGATSIQDLGNGHYIVTLSATAVVTVTCTATDDCGNESDPCSFTISATCNQACSPGYWRQSQHFDEWCLAGFQPVDNYCGAGPATLFADAFNLTDFSSAEIPASFDETTLTLLEAVNMSGGDFAQSLFLGSAALLNAAHPSVGAGAGVTQVQQVMQDAFDGTISFAQAKIYFAGLIAQEDDGGCPLN